MDGWMNVERPVGTIEDYGQMHQDGLTIHCLPLAS